MFLERKNKLKKPNPRLLNPKLLSWQLERKGMKCDAKEKLLRRKKNYTLHPEMIVLKFGNVCVSSVTNSIMNTKRISNNQFFILKVLAKISMKTC